MKDPRIKELRRLAQAMSECADITESLAAMSDGELRRMYGRMAGDQRDWAARATMAAQKIADMPEPLGQHEEETE